MSKLDISEHYSKYITGLIFCERYQSCKNNKRCNDYKYIDKQDDNHTLVQKCSAFKIINKGINQG